MTSTQEWQRHYIEMRKHRDFWRSMTYAGCWIMLAQLSLSATLAYLWWTK